MAWCYQDPLWTSQPCFAVSFALTKTGDCWLVVCNPANSAENAFLLMMPYYNGSHRPSWVKRQSLGQLLWLRHKKEYSDSPGLITCPH